MYGTDFIIIMECSRPIAIVRKSSSPKSWFDTNVLDIIRRMTLFHTNVAPCCFSKARHRSALGSSHTKFAYNHS